MFKTATFVLRVLLNRSTMLALVSFGVKVCDLLQAQYLLNVYYKTVCPDPFEASQVHGPRSEPL